MERKNNSNDQYRHYVYYSPCEILNLVASSKNFIPVRTRGKLIYESGFPRLVDDRGYMISLENIQTNYPEGALLEVNGILKCYTHPNGGIYPRIDVREIIPVSDENFEISHLEQEMLSLIKSKPDTVYGFYPYFEKLVSSKILSENNRITISVVHGKDAQTHRDFEHALLRELGNLKHLVALKFHETILSNDVELANVIRNIKDSDAIFIVRGGGKKEELERIGGRETCRAIIEKNIPVYSAIGHSFDRRTSLLEKICQASFLTPSLAGTELGKLIRMIYENLTLSEKTLQEKILSETRLKEIQNIKTTYENRIKSLEKENKIYLAVIISLAIIIIFLFLK